MFKLKTRMDGVRNEATVGSSPDAPDAPASPANHNDELLALCDELDELYSARWKELDARVTDLSVRTSLIIDASLNERLEAGLDSVHHFNKRILATAKRASAMSRDVAEVRRTVAEAEIAYIRELDSQLMRLMVLIGMAVNPAGSRWLNERYPHPQRPRAES
jgi:hypothetical protein